MQLIFRGFIVVMALRETTQPNNVLSSATAQNEFSGTIFNP